MAEGARRSRWASIAAMAALFLLLVIQLIQGVEGFVPPHGGLLGVLEVPGTLLGWGGVLLVAFALAWLLLGWWGRGLPGITLRLLGCIALAMAVAGLLGLAAGTAGGGRVGVAVGTLLADTLGGALAVALLLLMALPGLVLAAAPFLQAARTGPAASGPPAPFAPPETAPATGTEADERPSTDATGKGDGEGDGEGDGKGSPYPERRFDEEGNEIPMELGGSDVGPIRYLDEAEEELRREPERPPPVDVEAETPDGLPAGVRFADEPAPAGPDAQRPLDVEYGHGDVPLPPGVRFVGEEPDEDEDRGGEAEATAEPDDDDDAAASTAEEAGQAGRPGPGDALPPAGEVEAVPAPPEEAPPAPKASPSPPRPPSKPRRTVSESLAKAMDSFQDDDGGARYRAKLAGTGIFDAPSSSPPRKGGDEEAASGTEADAARGTEDAADTAKEKPRRKRRSRKRKTKAAKKKSRGRRGKADPAPAEAGPGASDDAPTEGGADPEASSARPKKASRGGAGRQAGGKAGGRGGAAREAPGEPEPAPRKGAPSDDALYDQAVSVAFERGSASSVLLSRKLGIGYARARTLLDQLVEDGLLGDMSPSGSRPVIADPDTWEGRG